MRKSTISLKILDPRRRAMLPKLAFLRHEYGFYLAGGTALAMQIGHRTSVDFDFYSPRDFDPQGLYRALASRVGPTTPTHVADGTLMVAIQNIAMSFFRYDAPLLKPLVRSASLDLASIEDIAAMKIIAIVQRGTRRDFVDVYYLLKRHTLEVLLRMTEKKYAAFNRYIGLRALTYFEDAEEESSQRRLGILEPVAWDRIKQGILEAVRRYKNRHLPRR